MRGWLGVQIQPVTKDIADALALDEANGAMVTEPQGDSPASKAGIKAGDVITAVNGQMVRGPKALARLIGEFDPDSKVTLTIVRNGEKQDVSVTLGKLADQVAANSDTGEKPGVLQSEKLGMALAPSPNDDGVLVLEVVPNSAADAKGVVAGDVVASVNGEQVRNPQDVEKLAAEAREAGRKGMLLQIKRDGNSSFVAVPFEKG